MIYNCVMLIEELFIKKENVQDFGSLLYLPQFVSQNFNLEKKNRRG